MTMNAWWSLGVPFGLGLAASIHCAQMCGPVVLASSLNVQGGWPQRLRAQVSYQAGRWITYGLLGALAGAVGAGVSVIGDLAGLERGAAIVAGTAMILVAILLSGRWRPSPYLQIGGAPSRLTRLSATLLRTQSRFALGLAMGFLPCGLVYAALIKSVESGSAVPGALSMIAFAAGTSWPLLGIGLFSSAIPTRWASHADRIATVSYLLLGAVLLWRGIAAASQGSCHAHAF